MANWLRIYFSFFIYFYFFVLLRNWVLPVAGTSAVVVDIGIFVPLLHLYFGEGDAGSGFRNLKDVGILKACLPLHVFAADGGGDLISFDFGREDIITLRVIGDIHGWHEIPFLANLGLMVLVGIFLVRDGELENALFCCFPGFGNICVGSRKGIGGNDISFNRGFGI